MKHTMHVSNWDILSCEKRHMWSHKQRLKRYSRFYVFADIDNIKIDT